MGQITRFILFIGPISSIFDYTTFAIMWFLFKCRPEMAVPADLRRVLRIPSMAITLTALRSFKPAGLWNPS